MTELLIMTAGGGIGITTEGPPPLDRHVVPSAGWIARMLTAALALAWLGASGCARSAVAQSALDGRAVGINAPVGNAWVLTTRPALFFGDYEPDGDVDLADYAAFSACFNGANRPYGFTPCDWADEDSDADVDLGDFAVFQACFNGPNARIDPGCYRGNGAPIVYDGFAQTAQDRPVVLELRGDDCPWSEH